MDCNAENTHVGELGLDGNVPEEHYNLEQDQAGDIVIGIEVVENENCQISFTPSAANHHFSIESPESAEEV